MRYEGSWFQIKDEIELVKFSLEPLKHTPLLQHFGDQLVILEFKLAAACFQLHKVVKDDGQVARISYALRSGYLKRTEDEVVTWAANFQPSWFATVRSLKDEISHYVPRGAVLNSTPAQSLEELHLTLKMAAKNDSKQSVFPKNLFLVNERPIISSFASSAVQIVDMSKQAVMVEILDGFAKGSQLCLNTTDICILAKRLSCIGDPVTCGLLRYRGVLKLETNVDEILKCAFVFEVRAAFLVGFESFRFASGTTNLAQKLEW